MPDYEEGDTVQLKSGGPIMTVETIGADKVICTWFSDKKRNTEAFKAHTLSKWSPSGPMVV